MKTHNIDWNLSDLLQFHKTKGHSFNQPNNPIFFPDPSSYMAKMGLTLSRRRRLLIGLTKVLDFLICLTVSGENGCNLTIEECSARKNYIEGFKESVKKQYTKITTSSFCKQQEERLLINANKGSEMPMEFLKQILNIWIFSETRRKLFEKVFNFPSYLTEFCREKKYPSIDMKSDSIGIENWSTNEKDRLKCSSILRKHTTEIRALLQLEILSLGIGHRSMIVCAIQIKDIILPRIFSETNNELVISNTKTKTKYGLCYVPIDQIILDGCLMYLRYIRTIYQGFYKNIEDWPEKSLFVTHRKNSRQMTKPSPKMDKLIKDAVREKNPHILNNNY